MIPGQYSSLTNANVILLLSEANLMILPTMVVYKYYLWVLSTQITWFVQYAVALEKKKRHFSMEDLSLCA